MQKVKLVINPTHLRLLKENHNVFYECKACKWGSKTGTEIRD